MTQNYEIHDNIDELIHQIKDNGNELQTKHSIVDEMKTILSQMAIFNKLRDGLMTIPFTHQLSIGSIGGNQYPKYALQISIDDNYLIDNNIKAQYWRLSLQISSQSDDRECYDFYECQSIQLNKFESSATVAIGLHLSPFQYNCLPLVIKVNLMFEPIGEQMVPYIHQLSDSYETQTSFHIQLTEWSLNELHFLSFINYFDQSFNFKQIVCKDLKSMNRLEEDLHSSLESQIKQYNCDIFVIIATIRESLNIESNDKSLCVELIKYLIPKPIPIDCIVVNDMNASIEAFYFGHQIKLIVSIFESQPKLLNISIEAQNVVIMTTIRKPLIQSLKNLSPISVIDENKISLSQECQSEANQLKDKLNCVIDNKDIFDIYMDVRHKVTEKLPFI